MARRRMDQYWWMKKKIESMARGGMACILLCPMTPSDEPAA
jgi:hypothetical protein